MNNKMVPELVASNVDLQLKSIYNKVKMLNNNLKTGLESSV